MKFVSVIVIDSFLHVLLVGYLRYEFGIVLVITFAIKDLTGQNRSRASS